MMTLAQQEQSKSKISCCIHETKQVSDVRVLELCRNIAGGNKGYPANSHSEQVGLLKERRGKLLMFVVGLRNAKCIAAVTFIYLEPKVHPTFLSPGGLLSNDSLFACVFVQHVLLFQGLHIR